MTSGGSRAGFALHYALHYALRYALHYALRFVVARAGVRRFPLGHAGFGSLAFFDISICVGDSL